MLKLPKELRQSAAVGLTLTSLLAARAQSADRTAEARSLTEIALSAASFPLSQDFRRPEEQKLIPAHPDTITAQLHRSISVLRARGYTGADFECLKEPAAVSPDHWISAALLFKNGGVGVIPADPAQMCRDVHAEYLRASPEIVGRHEGRLRIAPFSLEITKRTIEEPAFLGLGRAHQREVQHLRVLDHLCADGRPVLEIDIRPENEADLRKFKDLLEKEFERRKDLWKAKIDGISPAPPGQITDIAHYDPAADFCRAAQRVKITGFGAVPHNGELDCERTNFQVKDGQISRRALSINGQVDRIDLDVPLGPGTVERDALGFARRIEGRAFAPSLTDRFGNLLESHVAQVSEKSDSLVLKITVLPPADCRHDGAKLVPLDIDLSSFGLGVLKDRIHRMSMTLVDGGRAAEPEIYTSMDARRVEKEFSPLFAELRAGVRVAAELFGLEPGRDVKFVAIHNSRDPNAFFFRSNPSSITVLDEMLRRNGADAREVAQHEVFHLVDSKYGGALSSGHFQDVWSRLAFSRGPKLPSFLVMFYGSDFFSSLNERNFMAGTGGHSDENSAEFFASFCNSLTCPDWPAKMSACGNEFRQNYYLAVRALEANLRGISAFPADAPIVKLLDERRHELEMIDPMLGIEALSPWRGLFSAPGLK